MKLVDFITCQISMWLLHWRIYRYHSWELVQIFATESALSCYCRLSTKKKNRLQKGFVNHPISVSFKSCHKWSVAWCTRSAKTDVRCLCVTLNKTRGPELESLPKAKQFWKSWVKFEFKKKKKGRVFGILSQLKNIIYLKMWMHKTLLSST
jgi:hypothetical protein